MSYDLMNRRDSITKHHTSVADSLKVINHYLDIGAPASKMNRTLHSELHTAHCLLTLIMA